MKYRITIEERTREVEVQVLPDGQVVVSLDGVACAADVVPVPGGVSLTIAGRVYDVMVGGASAGAGSGARTVASGEARAVLELESDRARSRRDARAGHGLARKELRAPMPGRIVKVLAAAGDALEAGAPIIVIEAMKMENELRVEGSATVKGVHVTEGANVEGNALLVTFE